MMQLEFLFLNKLEPIKTDLCSGIILLKKNEKNNPQNLKKFTK